MYVDFTHPLFAPSALLTSPSVCPFLTSCTPELSYLSWPVSYQRICLSICFIVWSWYRSCDVASGLVQLLSLSPAVVWGECNHSFHNCCMSLWVKQNNRCPLCQQDWVVQRIGKWEPAEALLVRWVTLDNLVTKSLDRLDTPGIHLQIEGMVCGLWDSSKAWFIILSV